MNGVAEALERAQQEIQAATLEAGRSLDEVQLVAVSKRQSLERCYAAYDAGQRVFGENTAQELLIKAEAFAETGRADVQWHFIGRLQRNKVRKILPWVQLIQSLDRLSLAEELQKHLGEESQDVLLQVNIGEESQKGGVAPDEVMDFCREIQQLKGLRVCGLMGVPPRALGAVSFFDKLKDLRDRISLEIDPKCTLLSMGMTNDFKEAIQAGTNMVRIGEGIFGPRDQKAERKA